VNETAALWTQEQQRMLAALDCTVWMRGEVPSAFRQPEAGRAPAPDAAEEAAPPALPPARREFRPKAPPRPAPVPRGEIDDRPVAGAPLSAPVRRAAPAVPDRLHIALIRAAGINPNAPESAEIIARLPASSELRGNPAAKRALWPRLRALRAKARAR
jgi:hypothetical protein